MRGMSVTVINLDRSTDRLDRMARQLDALGIGWQRMSAIAPTSLAGSPLYRGDRASALWGRDLRPGELGCFLSHLACIDAFLASDAATLLVLEDDVALDRAAWEVIRSLPDVVGLPDWRCINLSSGYRKRRSRIAQVGGHDLFRAWQFPLLTSALLWSRTGAEAFRAHVARTGIRMPVDNSCAAS